MLAEVYGISARSAFLYWATDPLDNPDYEHFLTDFYDVFGVCPQTTTAQGQKDIERTRRVMRARPFAGLARRPVLDHRAELAVPRARGVHPRGTAAGGVRAAEQGVGRRAAGCCKSNAGRARKFAKKRSSELVSEEQSSTIACVSGFLFNMVDRTVKLISPCNASDRWPLGYWVIAQGTFDTADELRDLMRSMIDETIRDSLGVLDTVRLRHDVRIVVGPDRLRVVSMGLGLAFENQPQAGELAELLAAGTYTVEQIALRRRRAAGVAAGRDPRRPGPAVPRRFLRRGAARAGEPRAGRAPRRSATGLLELTATGRPAE